MLYETQAICRYVDEAFDGTPLQPADAVARARMSQTIGVLDAYAYRPMVWDLVVQRVGASVHGRPADEAVIASALPKVRLALSALAGLLAGRPHFGGASPSLADLHAYPMLALLGAAPEGEAALRAQADLLAWRARMSLRPSALRTKTSYECRGGPGTA